MLVELGYHGHYPGQFFVGTKQLLSRTVVMGILNATPDSFYNKGQDSDVLSLLRNAEKMLKDGAAILDIGGALYSRCYLF